MAEGLGNLLTTAEAASAAGLSRSALHSLAHRARADGVELHAPAALWPDGRTPLWDRVRLRDYLARRPGRGANLRRSPLLDAAPGGQLVLPVEDQAEDQAGTVDRSASNGGTGGE